MFVVATTVDDETHVQTCVGAYLFWKAFVFGQN
jgi:hypothetical protein